MGSAIGRVGHRDSLDALRGIDQDGFPHHDAQVAPRLGSGLEPARVASGPLAAVLRGSRLHPGPRSVRPDRRGAEEASAVASVRSIFVHIATLPPLGADDHVCTLKPELVLRTCLLPSCPLCIPQPCRRSAAEGQDGAALRFGAAAGVAGRAGGGHESCRATRSGLPPSLLALVSSGFLSTNWIWP